MIEAQKCREQLRWFAEQGCRGQSPLYERLCQSVADDESLVEIVRQAPASQPAPNLFLAAVHYLLLSGVRHELAEYYGSCLAEPRPPEEAFAAFRDVCLVNEGAIRELIARRSVQTNEVGRCAYLLPAFCHIARPAAGRPLALIEVGASAGLNLLWDRYTYDYGSGQHCGSEDARVRIRSELRGNGHSIPAPWPTVAYRVGIDLHPVDVTDASEALWLRSLVWPDQPQRMALLTVALEEAAADPPELIAGNALELLPAAIERAPREATLCVLHCHTLNQFSEQERKKFSESLAEASRQRPLVQLSAEWIGTPLPELKVFHWEGGESQSQHLANVDHHGRWIEWLAT